VETILDKIIKQKKIEVEALRRSENIKQNATKKRSLINKIAAAEEMAIIAEYKRASPSKGIINNGVEPAEQVHLYENYGASAISVLTDSTFFKGSFEDLRAARSAVDLPILCKDFIIDSLQIDQASENGADLILLIVAALSEEKLLELFRYAKDLNLEVLIEVHSEDELEIALKTGAKLIGINNRDLKTFHVSLEVTERLAPIVKAAGAYLISESGIHQQVDVERVKAAGANGILVGEALMKSTNMKQSFLDFRIPVTGRING
jgi:indole-3-glycerol phosphate synthase